MQSRLDTTSHSIKKRMRAERVCDIASSTAIQVHAVTHAASMLVMGSLLTLMRTSAMPTASTSTCSYRVRSHTVYARAHTGHTVL
jgi:predicted MarR family transcription regulator